MVVPLGAPPLRRRAVRGGAPVRPLALRSSLWGAIAATVATFIVSGWLFVRLIEATFSAAMGSSTGPY
jgi:hypothetical protein